MKINIEMSLNEIIDTFEHHVQSVLTYLAQEDGTVDTEHPIFSLAKAGFIASEILRDLKNEEDDSEVDLDTRLEYEIDVDVDKLLEIKKEVTDGSEE